MACAHGYNEVRTPGASVGCAAADGAAALSCVAECFIVADYSAAHSASTRAVTTACGAAFHTATACISTVIDIV